MKGSEHALPYELLQIGVLCGVCARPVLALVHRTIHASLKECTSGSIGAGGDKLVKLVDIALKIAPDETRIALGRLSGAELELFADKEYAFLVG